MTYTVSTGALNSTPTPTIDRPHPGAQAVTFTASDYASDSNRLAGTVEAGLRKCRVGRSSCRPVPASSVGVNAAARLIYGLRHSDHISNALISLHWPRAQERVRFKTAVLMYKAAHGTAPSYLSQLVRVADLPGRLSLPSARTNHLLVYRPLNCLPSAAGPSQSPDPPFGTACRTT